MKTYFYILENINPHDNSILYVGKTNNLERRFSEHSLRRGKHIKMTEIDSVNSTDREDWMPIERYWIEQFKAWGFNLLNISKGGGGHGTISDDLKKHLSDVVKGKPRPWVIESNKRRQGVPLKPYKRIECPHCGTDGIISNMVRWHFDNCKHKK